MLNLDTNQNVVYTILGPWESDPEKNIISYKAPLGIELMDSEKDEELHFEINGTQYGSTSSVYFTLFSRRRLQNRSVSLIIISFSPIWM